MQKVVKNGMIAVIYSPNYGAGWYSWHGVEELVYDRTVVEMIENNTESEIIEGYCKKTDDCEGLVSAYGLEVVWIPEGTEFQIHEYDGSESIRTKSSATWLIA